MKRPLLSAAVTQLIAAVISTYCYREKLHWSAVPVIVLVGILAFEVLRICVRFNKNSCLYYLIFLIFPVTIIRTGIVSDRLGKCYEDITFTGTYIICRIRMVIMFCILIIRTFIQELLYTQMIINVMQET